MIHPWHDVTPSVEGRDLPACLKAIIEISQGTSNKYELDKGSGMLKLDRVLSSAVFYPANYGFIPQTLAEDDDPLDVLVFCSEKIQPMCLCEARVVGLMSMIDDGKPDHKILAALLRDPVYDEYRDASDFPKHTMRMIRRFFEDYKLLEGREVEVDEVQPAERALPIIEDALQRYSAVRRKGSIRGLVM